MLKVRDVKMSQFIGFYARQNFEVEFYVQARKINFRPQNVATSKSLFVNSSIPQNHSSNREENCRGHLI